MPDPVPDPSASHVALIAAIDRYRAIGKGNTIPWHLPDDFQYFRHRTLGHHVIMGRKTFQSIGRPLPGRANVVITRQPDFRAAGITVVHTLEDALKQTAGDPE